MVYGILIILVLISVVLGFFLDISDLDDNNDKYQEGIYENYVYYEN